MFVAQASGERSQSSAIARDQYQIVAASGEAIGIEGADPPEAPVISTEAVDVIDCSFRSA
jgi:hypothetical protein